MLETLSNPIFWQGVAAAIALAGLAFVAFVALIGRANDDIPLRQDRRAGDRGAWPERQAGNVSPLTPRTARSQMRSGPR